jgi:hypothetical protein
MMSPELLEAGKHYPGTLPAEDGAVFELPKTGPELRLFFLDVPDAMVDCAANDAVRLGVFRHGDIGVVVWRIGDRLRGDAPFHVFMYPPEQRPTDEILSAHHQYSLQLILVDRSSAVLKVVRPLLMSHELSVAINEIIAHQLGSHIERAAYDAQVSIYENRFPDMETLEQAADCFEELVPLPGDFAANLADSHRPRA